jgi:hypothetical protein
MTITNKSFYIIRVLCIIVYFGAFLVERYSGLTGFGFLYTFVIGTFSTKFQAVKPRMVKSYI